MVSVPVERRRNLVNGEIVEGTRGEWEQVLNPTTGEVIAEVPKDSEEDVADAVEAAHEAFVDGWFETTPPRGASSGSSSASGVSLQEYSSMQ
jgi:acyl-CoA reductase-like NAD-dependent aldehyde dehydrogenase